MTTLKMRERMAEIATEARSELEKINDKTSEADAKEIESRFDKAMSDYDALKAKCEREERLESVEKETRESRRPGAAKEERAAAEQESKSPEYREVFSRFVQYGTSGLDSEEREVLMTGMDAEVRAQSVGTDSAGGYTVPTILNPEIDLGMAAWGPMWDASIVREFNTGTGAEVEWPTVDDTGSTGRITAENTAVDDDGTDDIVFAQKLLNAYMYNTGVVKFSTVLLNDSDFNLESLIQELFAERLGRTANTALTTGTGTAQPNGIVTAAGAGITAASGTLIAADELFDMQHTVDPAYRASPKCRWMFNDTTLKTIRKLKDGQNNYLWQMGDVRTGEPSMLLDKPYSVNQAMASPALSSKPIIFGDFSKYVVRKVNGFQMMTLRERYAEAFQVGMIGYKRFDGELLNSAAVKAMTMAAV